MSRALRVLVCDDKQERALTYAQMILDGGLHLVSVEAATPNPSAREKRGVLLHDLRLALEGLTKRVSYYLGPTPSNVQYNPPVIFDDFDAVIFDNDLECLDIAWRPTAEDFLGYIRAFTACKFTIVLNKFPDIDFDLYLKGDTSSKADLSLNKDFLSLPWLWGRNGEPSPDIFHPWYWPSVAGAVARRQAQVEGLRGKLDTPVLEFFQFTPSRISKLTKKALGALNGGTEGDPLKVNFLQFFEHSAHSLRPEDRKKILGTHKWDCEADKTAASERLDENTRQETMCRVVAAEISLWLQREVLGPQDALIDIPHLIERMPFLLNGDKDDCSVWNRAPMQVPPANCLLPDVLKKEIAPAALLGDMTGIWTGVPAFWWPDLDASGRLTQLLLEDRTLVKFAFCEDTSCFIEADDATEFTAGFHNIWDRRHIRKLPDVNYAPRARFAM